jgi:guanylate kinase
VKEMNAVEVLKDHLVTATNTINELYSEIATLKQSNEQKDKRIGAFEETLRHIVNRLRLAQDELKNDEKYQHIVYDAVVEMYIGDAEHLLNKEG